METGFKRKKTRKVLEDDKALPKDHGGRMARAIVSRMAVLEAAASLAEMPVGKPERCHQPAGSRDGQFAVDLVQPMRLVFEASHDPVPRVDDGGVGRRDVAAATTVEMVDYR